MKIRQRGETDRILGDTGVSDLQLGDSVIVASAVPDGGQSYTA
jgi:hypothetical protein